MKWVPFSFLLLFFFFFFFFCKFINNCILRLINESSLSFYCNFSFEKCHAYAFQVIGSRWKLRLRFTVQRMTWHFPGFAYSMTQLLNFLIWPDQLFFFSYCLSWGLNLIWKWMGCMMEPFKHDHNTRTKPIYWGSLPTRYRNIEVPASFNTYSLLNVLSIIIRGCEQMQKKKKWKIHHYVLKSLFFNTIELR